MERHDERHFRVRLKLPLAVNPSTGEILASELTSNEDGDASQVGPLLVQITGPIASVTADDANDGELVYQPVAERQPDTPVALIVPPRSTAVPSLAASTAPSRRDQHIRIIGDKARMGWQKAVGYGRRSHAETAIFRLERGAAESAAPAALAQADPRMRTGEAIYIDTCSACHNQTGAGVVNIFPRLANNPVVQQDDATSLVRVVLTGARGAVTQTAPTGPAMPSLGFRLNDDQVAAVVTYIRNSWGNAAPAVAESDVRALRAKVGVPR